LLGGGKQDICLNKAVVLLSFRFLNAVMDCNKEKSIVLCLLYFSIRIVMGLLVMKVAPGVPVFSAI
jgi:hypothetical protein